MAAKKKADNNTPKVGRIVSYEKLDQAVRKLFDEKYPDGYEDFAIRYPKPNGDFFYAIPLDTPTDHYLVKVDVKIDLTYDVDDDKGFFGGDDDVEVDGVNDSNSTDVDDLADSLADEFTEPA